MNRSIVNDRINPTINDRKRALFASKEFMSSVDCVVESSSRISGIYSSFTTNLPYAVRGVYACSLKSFSMPMNFGTNVYVRTFNVTYENVGPWPGDFTLPIGYYWYSISQGTVTYADAQLHPTSNNLLYFILNYFSGALDSLSVNPQTGGINWIWDSGTTGNVTSVDVPDFFQLQTTDGISWISNGNPIDLSGVRNIGLIISDLSSPNSKSNVVGIPNYYATIPVNVSFGSVLTYEPTREDIGWLGGSKDVSSLSVQVVDCATNVILPLVTDWSMSLRLYTSQEQTS